jgi:Dyp-type peroxidase family
MTLFEEPELAVDDIQGHVLVGFGGGFQRVLGMRFRSDRLAAAKTALRPWVAHVTSSRVAAQARSIRRAARMMGDSPPVQDGVWVAMSLSTAGLVALGTGPGPDDPLFREGAAASAFGLGDDVDASGTPIGWRVGGTPDTTPDLLVVLASDVESAVTAAAASLQQQLGDRIDLVYDEPGRRLAGEREHFGFVDGISQPGPRGTVDGVTPLTARSYADDDPLAMTHARPGQPLVWPGQFVFGYPTQRIDDPSPGDPLGAGDPLLEHGSILVFRRLRQDVAAFRAGMEQLAREFTAKGLMVEGPTVAAWCVGRWPDGTPVSLSPASPDVSISGDGFRRNGFDFVGALGAAVLRDIDGRPVQFPGASADARGHACPFFAHIRKVNPRDHPVDQGSNGITLRSQMLRRGIPYGPSWGGEEDGADRGLLFMAYQTSIANQFNRLMTLWVNNASAPLGDGIDPLIGAPPQGGRPLVRRLDEASAHRVRLPGRWVTTTGAGYFFTPGIRTLRRLFA